MAVPLIFCHYGLSNYLRYTLLSAKLSNPTKKIYLLGDDNNLKLCNEIGIEHINFNQFDNTELVIQFIKDFKFIAGDNHGREEWTRFVFLRWFYVNAFLTQRNIKSFWHFDSDNLIVSDLSLFEQKFSAFDNTEQCSGICINGFISSSHIIQLYTKHIIDLFNDNEYVNQQIIKCKNNPSFAFTEMSAYNNFKKTYRTNPIRLNCIECENTFDDCLASSDGMEQTMDLYNGYQIKSIYINRESNFFFKHLISQKYIRVNSFNLSWMPFSLIVRLFLIFCRCRFMSFLPLFKFRKNDHSKIDFITYSLLDRIIDNIILLIIKLIY